MAIVKHHGTKLCPAGIVFMHCLLVITTLTPVVSYSVRFSKYSNTHNIKLRNAGVFPVASVPAMASAAYCCSACEHDASCLSVSFRKNRGMCKLSPLPLVVVSAYGEANADWETYSKNEWFLVFRGTPGIGNDPYEAWVNGVAITTDELTCMHLDVTSCSQHYRNPVVDSWATLGIKEVKYSLYKDGREDAYVIFNGTGSNITNWFTKNKILASSWSDITSYSFNYFSIAGHASRRFFMSVAYKMCPEDRAYTVTITAGTLSCTYDKQPSVPQFLYSTKSTYGYPERTTDFDKADAMAIFIKS